MELRIWSVVRKRVGEEEGVVDGEKRKEGVQSL